VLWYRPWRDVSWTWRTSARPWAASCSRVAETLSAPGTGLENPTWKNTTVVPGEVEAVQQMKDSVDGQIFMTGSATTVRWLLANNLLDELRLLLHPVVVGSGQKLFDGPGHRLELVEQQTLSTGVVHLLYRPAT